VRMIIVVTAFLAFILCMEGCASLPAGAPHFVSAPNAPEGYATVYIYRLGAYPKLRRPSVFIGDVIIFDPPERALTWVYVRSGDRNIRVHWTWDAGSPDLSFSQEFDAGHSYFIKLSGSFSLRITPNLNSATANGALGTFARVVPQAEAQNELETCCKFMAPKVQRIL
jgi:hypothetical protein